MHSFSDEPSPVQPSWKRRIRRLAVGLLCLVVAYPLVNYGYFVYLRANKYSCLEEISPDGVYTLETCGLKTRKRLKPFFNDEINNIRIIENATGKVLHETPLYDADAVSMPTEWVDCGEIDEDYRPANRKPGEMCGVGWARQMGERNRSRLEYRTALPPSKWMQFRARLP